jgi:hypothetical protein
MSTPCILCGNEAIGGRFENSEDSNFCAKCKGSHNGVWCEKHRCLHWPHERCPACRPKSRFKAMFCSHVYETVNIQGLGILQTYSITGDKIKYRREAVIEVCVKCGHRSTKEQKALL